MCVLSECDEKMAASTLCLSIGLRTVHLLCGMLDNEVNIAISGLDRHENCTLKLNRNFRSIANGR